MLAGIGEEDTPVLFVRDGVRADELVLVAGSDPKPSVISNL